MTRQLCHVNSVTSIMARQLCHVNSVTSVTPAGSRQKSHVSCVMSTACPLGLDLVELQNAGRRTL